MKVDNLKKIIKDAVREAIQEELKDILLEAVRAPKVSVGNQELVSENKIASKSANPQLTAQQRKSIYEQMLGETAFTSQNVSTYRPNPSMDGVNGTLPQGDVSMDQIMGLMNTNK